METGGGAVVSHWEPSAVIILLHHLRRHMPHPGDHASVAHGNCRIACDLAFTQPCARVCACVRVCVFVHVHACACARACDSRGNEVPTFARDRPVMEQWSCGRLSI